MKTFCTKCGNPIEPDSLYCTHCGEKVPENLLVKNNHRQKYYIVGAICVIAIILFCVCCPGSKKHGILSIGSTMVECTECDGEGYVMQACDECDGVGQVYCDGCDGTGQVEE